MSFLEHANLQSTHGQDLRLPELPVPVSRDRPCGHVDLPKVFEQTTFPPRSSAPPALRTREFASCGATDGRGPVE